MTTLSATRSTTTAPTFCATGPRRSAASGPAPYRLLLVGGGVFAGQGVAGHDQALAGTVARSLAGETAHGVDCEVAPVRGGRTRATMRALAALPVARFDVVAVTCDAAAAREAADRTVGMLQGLRDRMRRESVLVLVLGPEALDDPAFDLAALRRAIGDLALVVALDDVVGEPRAVFARWGRQLAHEVAARLAFPLVWSAPLDVLDEDRRLRAVERSESMREERRQEILKIVEHARKAYGTSAAALSIVGSDRTVYTCSLGMTHEDTALLRDETVCNSVLPHVGGLIVSDASTDRFFADVVRDNPAHVGFYAGHRVRDADGEVIGALCVFDAAPRPVTSQDIDLLRDFAHALERLLAREDRVQKSERATIADAA